MHESGADGHYIVISADCHGGGDIADYRPYLPSAPPRRRSTRGPRRSRTPIDDLEGDERRPQLGQRRAGCKELEADGVVAEVIFPNTIPPFFPERLARVPAAGRRRRATSSCGGPGCRPTTAGSPTSAPPRPAGGPASRRSCCTTSTPRSPRSGGPADAGLTGGVLLPGAPPGSGLPPLYAPDYEPIWSVVRRARHADQPPQRQRGARLRRLPRGQGRCSCSRSRGGRTARSGT